VLLSDVSKTFDELQYIRKVFIAKSERQSQDSDGSDDDFESDGTNRGTSFLQSSAGISAFFR
jgi:hypothetical protein